MDATGDSRHEFNPTDADDLAKAQLRFKELSGLGFTAAVRRGDGRSQLVRAFDPSAEETLFSPLERRLNWAAMIRQSLLRRSMAGQGKRLAAKVIRVAACLAR
jgi:hypothetical protein